jgi:uncharacterized integral membrane protein
MAQTRRRRRKHRGTQGGSIDRRPSGPRPRSRAEARARARSQVRGGKSKRKRTVDRRDVPPTWRSAVNRALVGAGIFLLLLLVPFHQSPAAAIPLAVVMMGLYIPLGYTIEKLFYTRRQAKKAEAAASGKGR